MRPRVFSSRETVSAKYSASYAGLTRVSIDLRKSLSKWMDCRVKPGNDEGTFVSRARCGILHAASQNRDRTKLGVRDGPGSAAHRSAKSYALRCVRGARASTPRPMADMANNA